MTPTATATKTPAKKAPAKKTTTARKTPAKKTTAPPAAAAVTFAELPVADVQPHPQNVRKHVGDLDELVDSVQQMGVLEPIVVVPVLPDDASPTPLYRLIAGHRRLAAAKKAKLKSIPAVIRADLDTAAKQIEAMLVENLHRSELTVLEEARGYQALLEFPGYTQVRVAKATGRAVGTIRDRLKLTKLPKATLVKIDRGQLTTSDALVMVEFADDPAALTKLAADAGTTNWKWTLQNLRAAAAKKKKREKAKTALAESDTPLLTSNYAPSGSLRVAQLPQSAQDAHETCPGRAAYFSWDDDVVLVCTDPATHHPTEVAAQADAEAAELTPEEVAKKEADAQLERDLDTAAVVRRQHLAEVITAADDLVAKVVLVRLLASHVTEVRRRRLCAQVLGLDDTTSARDILVTAETLRWAQLVLLLHVMDHAGQELALEQEYGWPYRGYGDTIYDHNKMWRVELDEVYAYPWSDFETRMATVDPVEQPAADADADADVDEPVDDDE